MASGDKITQQTIHVNPNDPEETQPQHKTADSDNNSTTRIDNEAQNGQKPLDGLRIGAYHVIRALGEGGMGTVYLAARADQEFKKNVAIKVIRKGMDSEEILARFRRERQILAALEHPNIAKLFDGGTTQDGRPYFVMEYITGKPLTEFCDNHKLNIPERLKIFQSICSAVQFAHQNLIIHRDLKPFNILVSEEGEVKLLDFGIAKVINPDVISIATATDVRAMTPEYASPEQVRGEPLTTASDVYSLGVILYELLTGLRLYQFTSRAHMEVFRAICEQEPVKPSTAVTDRSPGTAHTSQLGDRSTPRKLHKQLRGDLDNIILMALRKEPQRRYVSVQALSEDIGRYLDGHPVQARKATWSYKAGKYFRRHTALVVAASLIVILLSVLAITTTIQNSRIRRERDAAERQKEKSEQVTRLLVDLFESKDPLETEGKTVTLSETLDRGVKRIRNELKDQPDVKAQLLLTIAKIYSSFGLYDEALQLLQESLKMRKELSGNEDPTVAETLVELGWTLQQQGHYQEAEKNFRESLEIRRNVVGNQSREVGNSLNQLSLVLKEQGRLEEAEKLQRECLIIFRNVLKSNDSDLSSALNNLALILMDKGELNEAEKLFREAVSIDRTTHGADNPALASVLNNLANVLRQQGKNAEVEKLLRESIAIDRKAFGDQHPRLALKLNNLSILLRDQGKQDEALLAVEEALKIHRAAFGDTHPAIATDLTSMALLQKDKGALDEAERLLREALTMDQKVLGKNHPDVAKDMINLADLVLMEGKVKEARSLATEALHFPVEKLAKDHKYRARAKSVLGGCFLRDQNYPEAEKILLESYDSLLKKETAKAWTVRTYDRILSLYKAWGKQEKAEQFAKSHGS